jgi:hypothetical protein
MEPGDRFWGRRAGDAPRALDDGRVTREAARMAPRWLAPVARASVVAHGLAAATMVLWLAPGLTAADGGYVHARAHPGAWTTGWLAWHAAAAGFVGTSALLALWAWRAARPRRGTALLGALAAVGGLALDLRGQWAYIAMTMAEASAGQGELALATWCSGVLGNALYSLGLLLLTAAWADVAPRAVRASGYLGGALGLALSPAAWLVLVGPRWPAGALTALLVPAVMAWSVAVARWAARDRGVGSPPRGPGAWGAGPGTDRP